MEPNLELRKTRDFGELINDTFLFAKQNWKPLLRTYFSICGFLLLATAAVSIIQQNRIANVVNEGMRVSSPFSLYSWDTLLSFVLAFVFYGVTTLTVFSYMSLYREKANQQPATDEVWGYVKYYFWRMLGAQFILALFAFIGFILCVIPGIYLWPVIMVILAVMVFENASFSYSFDRGFKLIRSHWWVTFGAMFIIIIVIYAAMMLFVLPISIITGVGFFMADFKMSLPILILSTVVTYICQVFMVLFLVLTGIVYFSLVEEKEGAGLSERISNIGKSDNLPDLPEEQY